MAHKRKWLRCPTWVLGLLAALVLAGGQGQALAAVPAPEYWKVDIAFTTTGSCEVGLIRVAHHMDAEGTHLDVFYLPNEPRPYVVWDDTNGVLYIDWDRDGVFDWSGEPNEESGGDPCETADKAIAVKPLR